MFYIATAAALAAKLQDEIYKLENSLKSNETFRPSLRYKKQDKERILGEIAGLRWALKLTQTHIESLALLANDTDGSYHEIMGLKKKGSPSEEPQDA